MTKEKETPEQLFERKLEQLSRLAATFAKLSDSCIYSRGEIIKEIQALEKLRDGIQPAGTVENT